jgi:hypothetical protein
MTVPPTPEWAPGRWVYIYIYMYKKAEPDTHRAAGWLGCLWRRVTALAGLLTAVDTLQDREGLTVCSR